MKEEAKITAVSQHEGGIVVHDEKQFRIVTVGGQGWTIGLGSIVQCLEGEKKGKYYYADFGSSMTLRGEVSQLNEPQDYYILRQLLEGFRRSYFLVRLNKLESERRARVENHPHTPDCRRSQDITVIAERHGGFASPTGSIISVLDYRETECGECHTREVYDAFSKKS
jgi:hypothetical protein